MIALQLSPLNQNLPMAKCSKHPSLSISPVLTRTSGALTSVWACSICESEDEKETGVSYLLRRTRKITPQD
jgi:hypothetical protein